MRRFYVLAVLAVMLLLSQNAFGAVECSHGATTSTKGNKLYLYFPTSEDASFVSTIGSVSTAPLAAFDIADLDSSVGTTAELRDRISDMITEDFCEFNVEVIKTTTAPDTTGVPRWQIVGIGSDDDPSWFGYSSFSANANDADPQDYTRVWAGSFAAEMGGPGGALNGADSTLERWAMAIGSTTSHESAHNYGVSHCDAGDKAGEDGPKNHLMNTSSVAGQGCSYTDTVTYDDRAGIRRHFSDQSYEVLAHNVGLNIMTVYNWDLVNPNAEDAHALQITLLTNSPTLTLRTWWNGSRSPWRDPTISSTGSTRTFQGNTYNEFVLDFSVDKSWTGGADGVVPGGGEFHIGAGFEESDLVIVHDTKLKDSGGADLTLHPRMVAFDRGAADATSGDFILTMFNTAPEEGDAIIRDMRIQYLPRLMDIDAMVTDGKMLDVRGMPVRPQGSCNKDRTFSLKDSTGFTLGRLSDPRTVDITFTPPPECKPGDFHVTAGDKIRGSLIYCAEGTALSMFPATSVYVTATVVVPDARHFDRERGEYVNGPLESKIFYQFAGIVPDLNNNGVDDLIDIREGTSKDANGNGVVDEAEPKAPKSEPEPVPWIFYLVLLILILIILVQSFNRRKRG